MVNVTPIHAALDEDEARAKALDTAILGTIGKIFGSFNAKGDNLLGFVLDMTYDEATIVTCDAWKRKCGGIPKNSFVVIRVNPIVADLAPEDIPSPSLILARVTEAVGTPVSSDIQQTIFQIHKVQAVVDPYTNIELQWSALKVAILGTYYDSEDGEVMFGNDIDTYVSPHFYEVYVPNAEDLEVLVNTFVSNEGFHIGDLRYTETQTTRNQPTVPIRVSPRDFVANRTALFGQTRSGKSNIIKVVADMMMNSGHNVGQLIFDLNGEYSNVNEQDQTSLFMQHSSRCVRYSLNPHAGHIEGVPDPTPLKVNFYKQVALGHEIIRGSFDAEHNNQPGYIKPFLEWEPSDPGDIETCSDYRLKQRAIRTQSMYFSVLAKALFSHDDPLVDLVLNVKVREQLARDPGLHKIARIKHRANRDEIENRQKLTVATRVYEQLYILYHANRNNKTLFPDSKTTGERYFDLVQETLLRLLGDSDILGTKYLVPFVKYHSKDGGDIGSDIVRALNDGKTIIVDLANADELIANYFSGLICRRAFSEQTRKFTNNQLGDHSILLYFEEAHNLFRRDDSDLRSIYNRLAKEGAKNRIGMVYATQSMTTLSPDLLKNTENFFIAHLNDAREIRELTYKYEFKDVGLDVQRSKTRGYVRMITLSHKFALPVQVLKFGPEAGA